MSRLSIRVAGILAEEDAAREGTNHEDRSGRAGQNSGPQASTAPPNATQAPSHPANARITADGGHGNLLPPRPFMTPQKLSAKGAKTHAAGLFKPGGDTFDSLNPDVELSIIHDEEGFLQFFNAEATNKSPSIGESALSRPEYGGNGNQQIWTERARTISHKWVDVTKDSIKGRLIDIQILVTAILPPDLPRLFFVMAKTIPFGVLCKAPKIQQS